MPKTAATARPKRNGFKESKDAIFIWIFLACSALEGNLDAKFRDRLILT
jgi:hypothetical protein